MVDVASLFETLGDNVGRWVTEKTLDVGRELDIILTDGEGDPVTSTLVDGDGVSVTGTLVDGD